MSATDKLRRMLDERGVEYKSHYLNTSWYAGMKLYMATDDMNGTLTVDNLTPEQAIAATLGSGTLTAEQVRKAIFDNSSYASYDGAKYYADGIGMQAIADELNSRAELGSEPPYDELLRCLENDWHIRATWDGLRKFWSIELTEEGVKMRELRGDAE